MRNQWTSIIEEQFVPFLSQSYSSDELECTRRESLESILVQIKNNEICAVSKPEKWVFAGRAYGYLGLLSDCLKLHRIPDLTMCITLNDHPISQHNPVFSLVPIFSFCKRKEDHTLLIPFSRIGRDEIGLNVATRTTNDNHRIYQNWHAVSSQILDLSDRFPIRDKELSTLFAGHLFAWDESRLTYALMAVKYPEILKCYITYLNRELPIDITETLKPFIGRSLNMKDYVKYKYLLHLDGNTASDRLRCLLAFNSVVLKTESPYFEFYYPLLVPGEHFVSIRPGLEDLIDTMRSLEADSKRYQSISMAGQQFVKENLSYTSVLEYLAELLTIYASLRRW
jgi:hypothetical protein